jgi:hypothetical protein
MMTNRFDRVEAHLRALFEENLPKIFTGHQQQKTLVDELILVMQDNLQKDTEDLLLAPDLFVLTVPTTDLIEWQSHQDILDEMVNATQNMGLEEGFVYKGQPRIKLRADQTLAPGSFRITAQFSSQTPILPDTAVMTTQEDNQAEMILPENAMLIIGGKAYFSLDKPVINIGRHSENDLVLSDPRVSRHHAQLRAIRDHFVIFDVGSTGGLFLNGRQITQATLHAGDVIRIGTVNLIYNQEATNAFPTSVIPIEDQEDFPEESKL